MWNNFISFINPHQPELSDDSYNSVEEEEDGLNLLVSPRRPPQSPRASPRALLEPDPPEPEQVLEAAGRQLRNLPDRQRRRELAEAQANMLENDVVVDFEDENGRDDAQAMQNACRNLEKFNWDPNDLKFTFQKLEIKMSTVGVKK